MTEAGIMIVHSKDDMTVPTEYCAETKEEFMNWYLDKKQCFKPDPVLMEQIIDMFDTYCQE